MCRGENSIDGYDRQYLTDLGFRVKSKYDVLASADGDNSVINRNSAVFVHCCCESGNLLSRPVSDDRVTRVDITAESDFTNESTVDRVIKSIRTSANVFFYCSPCTGGSSWQKLNLDLARRKGWKHTVVKLIGHWDLHWRLWTGFERVVRHCADIGASVLLEWPRYCSYWGEPKVSSFLRDMNFSYTDFDGCMYGLVSVKDSNNCLVPKPWRLASIKSTLGKHLNRLCDGSHFHVP
ncbi:MAG: hypothetical protein ACKPKO_21255, partial [Candidatus Fonsibacter sp.]